jgi:hypothetical protein|tara:strand:+ start:205 stop:516 length:312 start_codon:yes stop_codon:yes gene_type:complete
MEQLTKKTVPIHFIALAFLMTFGSQAWAYCSEPSFYMSTPGKPSVPYCVNEWDNTHTCDEWELQSYYNDMENYSSDVQEFINALNDYVSEASDFAQCMVSQLE